MLEDHEIEALLLLGVARELNASRADLKRLADALSVSKADDPQRRFKDADGIWRDDDGRFAPTPKTGRVASDTQRGGLALSGLLGGDDRAASRVEDLAGGINAYENLFTMRGKPLGDRTIEAVRDYSKLDTAALNQRKEQLNALEKIYTNKTLKQQATKTRASLGGRELSIERMVKSDRLLREDPDLLQTFTRRHMTTGERMGRLSEYYAHKVIDQQVTASLTKQRMPSLGSIVDAESGQIHNMWMGDGDHRYLPFDTKEMRLAKDNFVLRTRMHGGLTEQDLFWGLATNARGMAVANDTYQDGISFTEHTRNSRKERIKVYRAFKSHKKHLKSEQKAARKLVDRYGLHRANTYGGDYLSRHQDRARDGRKLSPEQMRERSHYFENKEQVERLAKMGESTMDSMALEMLQRSHPEHVERRTVKIGGKNNTKLEGARKKAEGVIAERLGDKDKKILFSGGPGRPNFTSRSFSDFDGDSEAWLAVAEQIEETEKVWHTDINGTGKGFWDLGQTPGQKVGIQMGREALSTAMYGKSPDEAKVFATLSPEAQRKAEMQIADTVREDMVLDLMRPEVQRKDPSPKRYDPSTRALQERIEQGAERRERMVRPDNPNRQAQQARADARRLQLRDEAVEANAKMQAALERPDLDPVMRHRLQTQIERNNVRIRNGDAALRRVRGSESYPRAAPNAQRATAVGPDGTRLTKEEELARELNRSFGKRYDLAEVLAANVRKRFSDTWAG